MRKALALLLALSLGLAQHQHGTPTPQTSPERSFLSGMMAHHEGALEMVRVALPDLKDPEVRAWAESILKEQDKEIGVMRALLARLGGLDQAAYQAMAREVLDLAKAIALAQTEEIHRLRLWLLK